jgi:hypothetical protein
VPNRTGKLKKMVTRTELGKEKKKKKKNNKTVKIAWFS